LLEAFPALGLAQNGKELPLFGSVLLDISGHGGCQQFDQQQILLL
jgi:hypothetical protein